MRAGPSWVTRRRNEPFGRVCRLSKLATHAVGTPSASGVSSSSDTTPRVTRVSAATTTDPIRSATGSRVRISTGRSPPGVAANQISPLCIGPIRPILGRTPIGDLGERRLIYREWEAGPSLDVILGAESNEVTMERFAQEFGAIDAKPLRPPLGIGGFVVIDTETEHCHTAIISCMTSRSTTLLQERALPRVHMTARLRAAADAGSVSLDSRRLASNAAHRPLSGSGPLPCRPAPGRSGPVLRCSV